MVPTEHDTSSVERDSANVSAADVETVQGETQAPQESSWLAELAAAPSRPVRDKRPLKIGDTVAGRYVIQRVLGAGGIGVVYEAIDTKLQRSVALKTHQCASDRARRKLLGEARAMAKLSHPNVVAVHDVGEFADSVFLAADLVRGTTLRGWNAAKAGWRETVRVFVDAGRGLAAAHALQIVHRDFKPENVLLDQDGRCYVTDFGLAALLGERAEPAPEFELETVSPDRSGGSTSRAWAGTPRYMAPEQFLGGRLDARADQFSFCVALYEALYGARPFSSTSLALLEEPVASKPVAPRVRVPRAVQRVLQRGLEVKAEDRFPDMEALLAELDLSLRPRRIVPAAALVAGATGAIVGGWSMLGERDTCGLDDAPLSSWDAPVRKSLEDSFGGSAESRRAWPAVSHALDTYAQDWRSAWREACLAGGTARPKLRVATFRCLTESERQFDGVVHRLRSGTDQARVAGLSRTASLLQPTECLDAGFVTAAPTHVAAPYASAFEGIREGLRKIRLDVDDGVPLATLERRLADLRGHFDPVRDPALDAEFLWTEVVLQLRRGPADAIGPLKRAYHRARDGGEPLVAVRAAAKLGRYYAHELGNPAAGLVWAEVASAEARQDGVALAAAIEAELALGIAYDSAGMWTEASVAYDNALERASQLPPETGAYTRAGILISVSGFEGVRGKTDAALAAGHEAIEIYTNIYGGPSRESLNATTNVGLALHGAQRSDDAKALFDEEYRQRKLLFGPDDPSNITVLINLAMVETALHNDAAARAAYDEADRLVVEVYGEQHPDRALIATDRAYLESRSGDEKTAHRLLERAVATLVASTGPQAEPTLLARVALADSGLALGELVVPCASYDEVGSVSRRSLGATRVLARALAGQGACAQARGELESAEAYFRESIDISRAVSDGPELRADAQLRLADVVLALRPAELPEARKLAERALADFRDAGVDAAQQERARTWLEAHAPAP